MKDRKYAVTEETVFSGRVTALAVPPAPSLGAGAWRPVASHVVLTVDRSVWVKSIVVVWEWEEAEAR